MNTSQWIFAAATLTAALGAWLILPRGTARGRRLGMLLSAASLGLFAATSSRLGNWLGEGLFWTLGGLTVVAATAYFVQPWGSSNGWAGTLGWPHYLVMVALCAALVAVIVLSPNFKI